MRLEITICGRGMPRLGLARTGVARRCLAGLNTLSSALVEGSSLARPCREMRGQAGPGTARPGEATPTAVCRSDGRSVARLGGVRRGEACPGMARLHPLLSVPTDGRSVALFGAARRGAAGLVPACLGYTHCPLQTQRAEVWQGTEGRGEARRGVAWCGPAGFGVAKHTAVTMTAEVWAR